MLYEIQHADNIATHRFWYDQNQKPTAQIAVGLTWAEQIVLYCIPLTAVFFPFLVKPIAKIGFSVFPKDVTRFFVSAVNKAMEERGDDSKVRESYSEHTFKPCMLICRVGWN